jgi:putative peptidoglycan lipid II flippase
MIMMPVMSFYAMTNSYQGILQSMDRHMSAALINRPSGIVILLYIALFADRFGVTGLLVTVVFGLFLQFAILPLPAHKAGFRFRPVVDFKDENIRTVGRMMLPVVLGASAYQFNMFFNNTMMSAVEPESVTLFNFVQTLILSSVMTLVLAITSVKYPALTVCAAKEDMMGFRKELSGTMGAMIYLLTPIAFGLVVLGHPLLELISLHGKVVPENIVTEATFLTMYSLCIVFLGLKEIADRALYSLRITRVSAWIGVVIMAVNILFGYILSRMTPLGAAGIPLGYSIGVIVGTGWLLLRLKKEILFFGGGLMPTTIQSILGSAVMSAAVIAVHRLLAGMLTSGSILDRALLVFVPMVAGMVVYFALTYLMKAQPIRAFLDPILKRGGNA